MREASGDQAGPGTANLAYAHKQKILRQVRRLEVDHVVLDLGAGTAFKNATSRNVVCRHARRQPLSSAKCAAS